MTKILVIVLILITSQLHAQSSGNMKVPFDKQLNDLFGSVKYDSVKIYSINCGMTSIKPLSISMNDISKYFSAYRSNDSLTHGQNLKADDIKTLVKLLRTKHKDTFADDPIGFFYPNLGVAFFKGGKVVTHLEYSAVSTGLQLQFYKDNEIVYKKYWSVVGVNMFNFFSFLCKRYKLECCESQENLKILYRIGPGIHYSVD